MYYRWITSSIDNRYAGENFHGKLTEKKDDYLGQNPMIRS